MSAVSCRVCGISNWLECGCYYLHGGSGGLGDMNTDWLGSMLDEMLDETTWSQVIDCVNCGHVPAHSPYCEVTV